MEVSSKHIESLESWDKSILAENTDLTFRVYLAGYKVRRVREQNVITKQWTAGARIKSKGIDGQRGACNGALLGEKTIILRCFCAKGLSLMHVMHRHKGDMKQSFRQLRLAEGVLFCIFL